MINELIESIVAFCDYCRKNGLNIGIKETLDAFEVVKLDLFYEKEIFKWSLRTVFCNSKEEFDKFVGLFENYWLKSGKIIQKVVNQNKSVLEIKITNQILSILHNQDSVVEDSTEKESSASSVELLRKTDFTKISIIEEDRLIYIAEQLWKKMSLRITQRYRKSNRRKLIDIRKTIRYNISKGGTPINLQYKAKKKVKPKITIFLDVSGSMDRYSFFLLRFIFILHKFFQKITTFIFSTRLMNITNLLNKPKLSEVLLLLEDEANVWSSGTTMGDCFEEFNYEYGDRILSGRPVVIVFSDGLETGNVEHLYNQLSKIKSKAKKLIWVTPLLGMQDYQPITKGLTAILPLFDEFTSAHNVDSLLNLEKYLTDVL